MSVAKKILAIALFANAVSLCGIDEAEKERNMEERKTERDNSQRNAEIGFDEVFDDDDPSLISGKPDENPRRDNPNTI